MSRFERTRAQAITGALWLAGMCRPWAAGYYCAADFYWHFEDDPVTPVCIFCGEPMENTTRRDAAFRARPLDVRFAVRKVSTTAARELGMYGDD